MFTLFVARSLISTRYALSISEKIHWIKACSTPMTLQKTCKSSVFVSHIMVVIAAVVFPGMVSGTG